MKFLQSQQTYLGIFDHGITVTEWCDSLAALYGENLMCIYLSASPAMLNGLIYDILEPVVNST